jgi:excisionase family DNA binding protein
MKCRATKTRPRLLRVPQAVDYLDHVIVEGTLRNMICAGRIPVVRIGGRVCIRTDVLDDLIAGHASASRNGVE